MMDFKQFTHDDEFHDIVNDENTLRTATEKFLNNIIDEITLGIIFDTHRKFKTNAIDLLEYESPQQDGGQVFAPAVDIFQRVNRFQATMEHCECPNCGKTVVSALFASHLEICMGLVRNRFRSSTRLRSEKKVDIMEPSLPEQDDSEWYSTNVKRDKHYRKAKDEKELKEQKKEKSDRKKEKSDRKKEKSDRKKEKSDRKKEKSDHKKEKSARKKEKSDYKKEKKDRKKDKKDRKKDKKKKSHHRSRPEAVWNLDDVNNQLMWYESKYFNFRPDFDTYDDEMM